ncbi:hypothetical protein D3C76_1585600 [compost metagenome]
MLLLILPYGNKIGVVQQNIRCHQRRVHEQAGADGFLAGGLVLELSHPLQLPHVGQSRHEPAQLCVSLDMGLHEDGRLGRVNARSHV